MQAAKLETIVMTEVRNASGAGSTSLETVITDARTIPGDET